MDFMKQGDENEMSTKQAQEQVHWKTSLTVPLIKWKITSWIIEMKTTETENED